MLRSTRSRVTKKQGLMTTDHQNFQSSSSPTNPAYRHFFASPRFRGFSHDEISETVMTVSPTSTLDTKQFSPFKFKNKSPFGYQPKSPKLLESNIRGIALALPLLDKPIEHISDDKSCPKVLFGAKLRVQIPQSPVSPSQSPTSPADFGIKTRNPNLVPYGASPPVVQTQDFNDGIHKSFLSMTEIELSEDYTRVIYHGPNPKTTHIFGNTIVESHHTLNKPNTETNNFLCSCYNCKKQLDQKSDIFIYRGEQSFCSNECRYQAMLLDEVEK